MNRNCVPCRGHYLVVNCNTFYLSFQWQCNTWTLSIIHRLWTVCELDPFPVPGAESLTPDLAKDLLVSPQASPTGDWSAPDTYSVLWVHRLVLRCLQESYKQKLPFLMLCFTGWDLEGRCATQKWLLSGLCISVSHEDVLPFDAMNTPPSHHFPWLSLVLRGSVM